MQRDGVGEFAGVTTAVALSAVGAANLLLGSADSSAFVAAPGLQHGQRPQHLAQRQVETFQGAPGGVSSQRSSSGLLGFGAGFGLLASVVSAVGRSSGRRTSRRAAESEIQVAEKTETKPSSYLQNIPRTIVDKRTLDKMLSLVPKEQWEDPPEDSYLYTLKMYAETYGEGKATKMGWWDYWYMRINMPEADEFYSNQDLVEAEEYWREMCKGKVPMWVPGPAGLFYTGAQIQWRGAEMFAGDQLRTPVTDGGFAKQFIANLAFYREGLKPWQRGLEIGMAHGYFIIGPFVSLGPLRNTPEAATVGLLAGCALIGIVSVGGLLFGATIKPTLFDKEGDAPAAGYQEMINWHALGGIGGAGFAHALITVFGG